MSDESIVNLLTNADKFEVRTVYQINSYHDERGGDQRIDGYCATRECAEIEAKGKSFWGEDGRVSAMKMIVVTIGGAEYCLSASASILIQDTEHAELIKQKRIRDKALSKLTEEERKALGL